MIFKTVPVIKTSEWKESTIQPGLQERTHEVILLDMYVDDVWHGSRRTQEQCEQYFAVVKKKAQA